MASTNAFLTLYSTVQTNLVGSTIATGYIPYVSTAGRQAYTNTLSSLTVATLTAVSSITGNVNCSTMVTSTISGVKAPTVSILTTANSGGSYAPPAGTVRIRVRMCGPGGGGSASTGSNSGTNGGNSSNTTFGPSGLTQWIAYYGTGGTVGGYGGYCAAIGQDGNTGTRIMRVQGGSGTAFNNAPYIAGGAGGVNPFGGAGGGGIWSNGGQTGNAAIPNTGAGGGGGGGASAGVYSGSGGGAGEYVEFYMNNPPASISIVIPDGGAGGTGGNAGGKGGSGVIIVEEFYI